MRKTELKDGTVVVQVGSCAGTQEATEHVESILRSRGIEPVLHGSRAYAICVPEDRASKPASCSRATRRRSDSVFMFTTTKRSGVDAGRASLFAFLRPSPAPLTASFSPAHALL